MASSFLLFLECKKMELLKQHVHSLSQDVNSICLPLFQKCPINGFSYSKVYPDGSRAELWSNPDALIHTFIEKKYISSTYTPLNFSSNERHVFLESKIESCTIEMAGLYRKQIIDQKSIFDQDNCFMIVNKTENYSEYYIFYTSSNCKSAINYYLNNLDYLENFIINFKYIGGSLCKKAETNRIIKPWRKVGKETNLLNIEDNVPSVKLSKQELVVIKNLMSGGTAKEIAKIMCLSNRTVESYIENIKIKFGCSKKSELLIKLLSC